MASSAENDAALARALQAQYDQEEQHNGNDMGVFDATLLHRRASNQQQSQPAENSILTADEALARQLAAQEQAEASAHALQVAHRTSHAAPFVQEEAEEETLNDDEDVYDTAQAQKAQQEYEDSRMALQWQRQEQERARAVEQAQPAPLQSTQPSKSRTRRILIWLATFLGVGLVIGVVYAIASRASGSSGNGGGGLLGDILTGGVTNQDIANNDPFTGQNQANTWEIDDSANHLDMIVLNALQSPWYPYFYKAVGDWDDGALEETNIPDVLELESQVVEYDYNCTEVVGFVKVCNGNYQETGWRGINDLVRVTTTTAFGDTTTYLISSRARMNDYYINPAVTDNGGDAAEISTVYDDSQYVMCHELGHAWGLLHTDEDFDNADTFNCMDYTRNSRDNQQPGTESLAQLAQMYGGGGNRQRQRRSLLRQPTQQSSVSEISKLPPSSSSSSNHANDRTTHVDWLRREMEEVYDRHSGRRLQPHKWKVLHQNDYAEAHEVELSHGHVLQVHKLLA